MTLQISKEFRAWLNVLRGQCADLAAFIGERGSQRLDELEWYGVRLVDLARDPEILLDNGNTREAPIESGHGFSRFIYRKPLTGALTNSDPTVWRLPSLVSSAWHPHSAAARELEASAEVLVREYREAGLRLLAHPDSAEIIGRGSWTAAFLSGPRSVLSALDGGQMSRTVQAITSLGLAENFGFAAYFRTQAGTKFHRHTGSSNLRLRHHLCVQIGEDTDGFIEVGGERRRWHLGVCLAFDDSFPHEVQHISGGDRVVLNLDTWHPELSSDERQTLSHPGFGQVGKHTLPERVM